MGHVLFNKGTEEKIDTFLYTDEVDCHCTSKRCKYTIYFDKTAEAFARTRHDFARPIKVNSWFRCQSHNEKVGGVGNSMHTRGQACDLAPVTIKNNLKEELDELEAIMKQHFDYTKRYNTFIHGHCFNGTTDERKD